MRRGEVWWVNTAIALCLAVALFAVYLLSYRGGFHSVDEVSMFAVAENVVKFGRFDTDQIAWTQWTVTQREAQGFFGVDGSVYSKKGLALSLFIAPLYAIARRVPGLGMLQTAFLLNPLVTALTAAILFLYVRRLGYRLGTALALAALFGLATIAWVYSKYLFSEPLAGGLLLFAAYLLAPHPLSPSQAPTPSPSPKVGRGEPGSPLPPGGEGTGMRGVLPFAAGLSSGLAVVARVNNLFVLPILFLYGLVVRYRRYRQPAPPTRPVSPPQPASAPRRRRRKRRRPRPTALSIAPAPPHVTGRRLLPTDHWSLIPGYSLPFALGAALPGLVLLLYNYTRSGSPFQTGYDLTIFSPHIALGLYKLLFSPHRGLFVFSPVLLFVVAAFPRFWHRHRAEAGLVGGVVGVYLLLFAAWTSGEGLSWGSRFLVPIVPFLILSLAPFVARLGQPRLRWWRWAFVAVALLSAAVQFLGVAINPQVHMLRLRALFPDFFLENTPVLWDFRYSPVWGQVRSWALANSDVAWLQPGLFDWRALAAGVGLLALALWLLSRLLTRRPATLSLIPLLLVPLLLVTSLTLTRYYREDGQFGPLDYGYVQALATVDAQARPDDGLVTLAWRDYHVPMNRYRGLLPIYGFALDEPPLEPHAAPLLARIAARHPRLWLIARGLQPSDPANGVERWLAEHAFKADDRWYPDDFRLALYATADESALAEVAVNARLGEAIALRTVRRADRPLRPGDVLPVALCWQATAAVERDYTVFVQLLAADGRLVAQHDAPPVDGFRPTSGWAAGETVCDRHGLWLPADLSPSDYALIAGMYDPATGARLPVAAGGDHVTLATVQVTPP